MSLSALLTNNRFLNLVELRPPKGVVLEGLLDVAARLTGRVNAVVVPDNPGALMSLCPAVLGRRLVETGHEVVLGVSCRDRNRIALQSYLLGASVDGVRNVLVTRGTEPAYGDHPRAKAVYDLEPQEVLAALRGLGGGGGGKDLAGNPLEGEVLPELLGGAELNPFLEDEALKAELAEVEQRVGAGARFLLTTPVHDVERFAKVMEPFAGLGVPVIARVMLLKSVGMARYLNRNVAGDTVPKATIKRLRKASDKGEESLRIAIDMARSLGGLCRGVCYLPLGWESRLPSLMDLA